MTDQKNEKVKLALLSIQKRPKMNHSGICCNLHEILDLYRVDVSIKAISLVLNTYWSKATGDTFYPIPSGSKEINAEDAYEHIGDVSMWDRRTRYGKLRHEALQFLIDNSDKLSVELKI